MRHRVPSGFKRTLPTLAFKGRVVFIDSKLHLPHDISVTYFLSPLRCWIVFALQRFFLLSFRPPFVYAWYISLSGARGSVVVKAL